MRSHNYITLLLLLCFLFYFFLLFLQFFPNSQYNHWVTKNYLHLNLKAMSQELRAWSHLQPKMNLRYPVSQEGGGPISAFRATNTQYFVRRLNGNLWKQRLRHGWDRSRCCLKCLARAPQTLSNTVRPSASKCTLCVIAPSVKFDVFRLLHANILTLQWQDWPCCKVTLCKEELLFTTLPSLITVRLLVFQHS